MSSKDDFGEPNHEGFRALLSEPFVESQAMLFARSSFDTEDIDRRRRNQSPEQVQRELNHVHLFLYAADIDIQRQWAKQLEETWVKRIQQEFPHLRARFNQDDNGAEVILTFWAEPV